MLITVPDAPYRVRCLPSIAYGTARASSRDWDVALMLDVLLPEPRPSQGDSAGSHLCLLLGVSRPGTVQAVIARSAPADLTKIDLEAIDNEVVIGSLAGGPPCERESVLRQLSPALHVHGAVPPFLIVHGTDDEIAPFAQAEAMVKVLQEHAAEVSFHVIDGGRHGLRPDVAPPTDNAFWEELGYQALAFFDAHLATRPETIGW